MSKALNPAEAKRSLLETYLRGRSSTVAKGRETIPRRPSGVSVPLSSWQKLIWLHSKLIPELPIYNEPLVVCRKGPLHVEVLERSLSEIIRRHEAWRTTFAEFDGEPVQIIQPPPTVTLPVTDLRSIPESAREAEALRLATEDAKRPFDLEKGPLIRAILIRLTDCEHRLFMTLHHTVFDDVGNYNVFLPELIALYDAFSKGESSPLRELPIQYADFAWWQHQRLQGDELASQMAYWRRQLSDPPTLELPNDWPRPPIQSFRGSMQALELSRSLSIGLKHLARQEGSTLFMTLMAAFQTLLHRYSGQEDIAVGTVTAKRGRPELEMMLGSFVNPIVLRTDFSGGPTFRELLRRVRDVTLGAMTHCEVPFDYLVKELHPKRDQSRNPLYQALLSLEPPMSALDSAWDLRQVAINTGVAKLDLYMEMDDRPDGLRGRLLYNSDLFSPQTIVRMLGHWQTLLEGIAMDAQRPLSRLPILTESERRQFSGCRNSVQPTNPFAPFRKEETAQSLPARFESIAGQHPHRVAVQTAGRKWTYRELNQLSNRIARTLLKQADSGEEKIALIFDHDALMVAAMLGTLKADKAYIPIDPLYPAERIEFMLEDSQANAILTSGANLELAARLAQNRIPVINVDEIRSVTSGENIGRRISPDSLAYILYTSGSTGRPKGVMQSHRNVLTFIRNYTNEFHISPEDRLSLISFYSFDAAVMDVYSALMNGACLCPFDVRSEGMGRMAAFLSRQSVSVYHSTPTLYRYFMETGGNEDLSKIRLVILGGEPVQKRDVERYQKCFSNHCLFANLSGQSESSLNLVYILDHGAAPASSAVPMGYPVDTELLLLDGAGHVTELFGEIGIRSSHVALGYWNRPELTSAAFVADPDGGGKRLYRTGDMGRLMADGSTSFVGRKDAQVKIRGIRIEPGEIEAVLERHPNVKEAAAAIYDDASGEKNLAAYWVADAEPIPSVTELRSFLKEKLPAHMIPSSFVRLDSLPLTPSGKLDRRALPAVEKGKALESSAFVPARDNLELQLTQMWEQMLGFQPIGIRDDFFELGGHSLTAVRLFALMEKTFGKRIPLSTLLQTPTIEQLANVLREEEGPSQSCLVPIQPQGSLPPLFCVHGHFGEVLFYRPLSQRLGPEQPFFALQAQRQDASAHHTIEAMAAHYLAEICKVQPRGPYFLGGFCLGAAVAFEIAQQLRARREDVRFLGLFLGYAPKLDPVTYLRKKIALHWRQLRQSGMRTKLTDLARNSSDKLGSLHWRLKYNLFRNIVSESSPLFRNIPEMNHQALIDYVPRFYPGRMTVFLSGDAPADFRLDPKVDLDGMEAREIELRRVPGERDTMLQEPFVSVLVEQLKVCLRNAACPSQILPSSKG